MKELKGKVAAVTGAASGLGRSMALAFAAEGMDVALADVDEVSLSTVQEEILAKDVRAITLKVDVSQAEQVEGFRDQALTRLGGLHVVCNNAGVSPLGAVWENSVADWQWILGVNLWGVIHGVRAFAPHLIAQNEGHIVNTASVAGLIAPPGSGAYNVTKHAVVALSESLQHDLRERGSRVGVSVLCPAYVPTRITESERSRPKNLPAGEKSAQTLAREAMLKKAVTSGKVSADEVAQAVVAAIKQERFYVLTHPRIKGAIQARMEDILQERAPRNPMALQERPEEGRPREGGAPVSRTGKPRRA
jgi:NAD(P)-dependent dehydrogenase (short-subunit alcohol dehydrogenase family)